MKDRSLVHGYAFTQSTPLARIRHDLPPIETKKI
jgi:hypothetical protein